MQLDDPNKPQNIIVQLKSNNNEEDYEGMHLYESPETLSGEEPTEASIVWNVGMVFYYLICKEPYFKSIQDIERTGMGLVKLDDVEFRQNLIPEVESLIEDTLRKAPEERITLDELLEGISQEINKIFSES